MAIAGRGCPRETARPEVPQQPKEGVPTRVPSPPLFLVSPVFSQFTSGLFRFLGLFFARQCGSHPPPRSAALGGVRAGCEQKRAKCELIDHAREPPLPPGVPPPFPVGNVQPLGAWESAPVRSLPLFWLPTPPKGKLKEFFKVKRQDLRTNKTLLRFLHIFPPDKTAY